MTPQAVELPGPLERPSEVRAERMRPHELEAAVRFRPVAFIPLGSLEFHSDHLPIGLDALTAHGVCVAAARRSGGVVLPPLYQATGGGHTTYPWTIMLPSVRELTTVLETTLTRLQELDFRAAVILTGHFSDEQLALVDDLTRSWNADHPRLKVSGTGVNRCPDTEIGPDHAGVFETSLLYSLHPELVDITRLPPLETHPSIDPNGDETGTHRHERAHPLWGVFGPDPRTFNPAKAPHLLDALAGWLDARAVEVLLP